MSLLSSENSLRLIAKFSAERQTTVSSSGMSCWAEKAFRCCRSMLCCCVFLYHAWIITLIGAINISWEHNSGSESWVFFCFFHRVKAEKIRELWAHRRMAPIVLNNRWGIWVRKLGERVEKIKLDGNSLSAGNNCKHEWTLGRLKSIWFVFCCWLEEEEIVKRVWMFFKLTLSRAQIPHYRPAYLSWLALPTRGDSMDCRRGNRRNDRANVNCSDDVPSASNLQMSWENICVI